MTGPIQRSVIRTEDGTVIIFEPELGVAVSGRNKADAEAEVRRLLALRRKAAA